MNDIVREIRVKETVATIFANFLKEKKELESISCRTFGFMRGVGCVKSLEATKFVNIQWCACQQKMINKGDPSRFSL